MNNSRTMPTVSVIVTCYNYGGYVGGCIESILAQTCQDFEIIVVDDGSTDNSATVISGYLSDQRINYIRQDNAGQAKAKNTGIRHSRGKFVAFLDADDLWKKSKLEKQLPLFAESEVGVVYSTATYIDKEGRDLNYSLPGKYLMPRAGRVTEHLFVDNFVPFSSAVVRADCLRKAGGFDESLKMGIDWDLWLRISVPWQFVYVDEPLLVYRLGHPGQMSKNIREREACADRIMAKFLQTYSDALSSSAINRAFAYTYSNRGDSFRPVDREMSNYYFLRSIRKRWFQVRAYRGLLRNAVLNCENQ